MKVSVFGLGYVGCVTAACFASQGHQVLGVDINPDKVAALNEGRSPIIEPGLEELVRTTVAEKRLAGTQDVGRAVEHADVVLICVGTPSMPSGNLDISYVERVGGQIGQALRDIDDYKVIILRSTVLPGTVRDRLLPALTKRSGKEPGVDFGVVANPEFLREGSAIKDFMNPPFTLLGEMESRSGDVVERLYESVDAPVVRTDPDTACMVKYASNAFHALKVTFANEIGRLSKTVGIDSTEVMDIFCQDTHLNISSRYLRPGFAFGGSCLPKDLRAMLYLGRHQDLSLPVLESILPSNEQQVRDIAELVMNDQHKRVGLIGLSFKPNTDDLRESPIVELVEILSGKGVEVRIFDENVQLSRLVGGNKAFIERVVPHISALLCDSMADVVSNSEVIVVAHDVETHRKQLLELLTPEHLVIDFVKTFSQQDGAGSHAQERYRYEGIYW
jgi:GDP-mannose 6-dehydrogenase